jgi:hypothetical protein
MNTSVRLDLNSGTWSDVDAFADCRSGHVAFSFLSESFLFCLGGSNKKDEYLASLNKSSTISSMGLCVFLKDKYLIRHSVITAPVAFHF